MPFFDVSTCNWHRFVAFWAFFVFSDFVCDNRVAASPDKFFSAVGAVGVFIFVVVNVSDVRIEDSLFFCQVICFF